MPKELKKWEITRQKGKAKFILLNGVLAWGLPMFIVMTFFLNRRPDQMLSLTTVFVSAIIWALGGALFGWMAWTWAERRYKKYLAARQPE